ncbi:MAG: U32 family peptidase, partial [Spirochaetes bacterium]|nr:U32 family peptidase [Spirochaetota bacterium]
MKNIKLNKPELIAPAGDLEKLKVAFHFGADAVYAGLTNFSLRMKTKNFNESEIKEAIEYTHNKRKKIYIPLNIYFTPDQIDGLINYIKLLHGLKPDGIIISDMGALSLVKQYAPNIPIHISTQANTTNQFAAKLLKTLGANRIILARELSLMDISQIKDIDITLEAFVHGAMCIAYSGRCLLSAYMTHPQLGKRKDIETSEIRSANKGNCAHSCRWEYILKEKTRGEQEYIITQDLNGTYVFSSKDICMINHIHELVKAGIQSLKIEGRMKSILYISSIVRAYRQAIDHWADPSVSYDKDVIDKELNIVSHREFCTGFFFEKPMQNANTTKGGVYKRKIRLAALVIGIKKERAILKVYNT